jgi:hypothetical protein
MIPLAKEGKRSQSTGIALRQKSTVPGITSVRLKIRQRRFRRPHFWRFRPGHVTHEHLGWIVNNSYDTDNITISLDRQDDVFRHWVIGFGSGDLHLQTMGGQGEKMNVLNVLFVGAKMRKTERLIATIRDLPRHT